VNKADHGLDYDSVTTADMYAATTNHELPKGDA